MPQYTPPTNGVVNFELQTYTAPTDGVVNFVLEDAVQKNYSAIFGTVGQNVFRLSPNSNEGTFITIGR
jgi:hypothetical protein